MEQRSIGSLTVSVVGLGCNNFGGRLDQAQTTAVVDAALDAGVTFLDTADIYGEGASEEFLGVALRGRRDSVVLATKFGAMADEGHQRGSPEWIRVAVERSLTKLQTDVIDLYQQHFPDADVPVADTLGGLHTLVEEGKVREIGISNAGSTLLADAASAADELDGPRFASVQNRYSVLTRDPEAKVLPACGELGVGLIPYFPLESGLLTGKYTSLDELPEGTRLAGMDDDSRGRFLDDKTFAAVQSLRSFAEEHGHSLLDLAFSWLLAHDAVPSVIAGATEPEQVVANAGAAGWQLSDADLAAIDDITGR